MFETLQERLQSSLRRLSGRGVVREKDLDEALEGIRTALLEADAALPAVRELSRAVRERGLGREVAESVTPAQQVVQIVFEELQSLLAAEPAPPPLARGPAPAPVLLAGLQGSGKTTTAAKLARWLGSEGGGRIALASLDLSRPAADRQPSNSSPKPPTAARARARPGASSTSRKRQAWTRPPLPAAHWKRPASPGRGRLCWTAPDARPWMRR